jgi:uncharacterized protein YdaU (DUF1376 family)
VIYFRCYIEAFEGATVDLSMLEDGAYNRLLRHYYRTELPLPLDSDKLARICKAITLEERAAIEAVLDRFFIRQPDGWHNGRADHEIEVSRTARSNGARGGRPVAQEPDSETGSLTGKKTGSVTGSATGDGGGMGQPSSLSTKTILQPLQPSNQLPSADAPRRGAKAKGESLTSETWEAYSTAYFARYGQEPVRNATVNGQLANVVRRLGGPEAPAVAAFYVRHNRADYVKALHPASLLARDCESLRTAWAAGRTVSETEARQADRTMATGNSFAPLLAEARAKVQA